MSVLPDFLPNAMVDVVALECGIRPINEVALALQGRMRGAACSRTILAQLVSWPITNKAMIRAAFHSDEPMWQGMALGQGLAACQAALGGLALPD